MAKTFFLFSCCVFAMLRPNIAWSWSFTEDFRQGFYWSSFPINFGKFVTSVADGELLAQITEQAQQEWEDAVGREIWNMSPGYIIGNGSGNHIRWSNNIGGETGYDPSTTLAVTVRYNSGTYFSKVEIILNGANNELRSNHQNMLKKTILHELGHTIGLDHSQQYSIMGPGLSGVQSLTADDYQGANAAINEHLYRQSIGYVSPLSSAESSNNTFAACGSVALLGNDSDQGPFSGFGPSLLIGLMASLLVFGRQFFPSTDSLSPSA
jgi:hypothetical protein